MTDTTHDAPHGGPGDLSHHTELPTTRPSAAVDRVVQAIGHAFSWLWIVVVVAILVGVFGRYAFGMGSVLWEEIRWHISSAVWLVGLGYTLVHDAHVRVDVLHERFGLRTQAWIELLGLAVLLLPFVAVGIWESFPYFLNSYNVGETSQSPGGLPARYVLKFFLSVSFALILVAGVSRLLKCTALLFGVPRPMKRRQQ
ncbi:TRAP-type mannitol/chloroaromatic compound transport system, small permease component [Limimonas halophila]|uniref:TRAP transporter small permease protein n=1 Tax=Limimonas halophila TaxID=1082479 RepID=A0A1G7LU54_9PROT|nr:TRAP transporter small permease subunit [Limimonas halophila]SDF53098.1 TRAP-type mannitol/chloroaromatic compound transport system, small permease component [Limimonas halophila]